MQNISTDATRHVTTWSANDLNYLYPILSRHVWLCLEIQHNQQLFPKRSGSPGSYHRDHWIMRSSTVYRSEVTDTLQPYPKLVREGLGAHLFNMWQRAFVLSVRRWRGEGRTQLPSYLVVWCWNVFTFEEKRKLTGEGGTGGLRARERLTITPWESQGNCLAMLAETQNLLVHGDSTLPAFAVTLAPAPAVDVMWCNPVSGFFFLLGVTLDSSLCVA